MHHPLITYFMMCCAWVLWAEWTATGDSASMWRIESAHETLADCQTALRHAIAADDTKKLNDARSSFGLKKRLPQTGDVLIYELMPDEPGLPSEIWTTRFLCLTDRIDPREPPGKTNTR